VAPLTGQDIRDLFRVQALIAGELAARGAATSSQDDLAELEALHHELIAAARRNDQALLEEKNHAFHRQINKMAGSRKILWSLSLITRYVPRQFYSSIPRWPQATVDDHEDLLNGIRAGDAERTRTSMVRHIVQAASFWPPTSTNGWPRIKKKLNWPEHSYKGGPTYLRCHATPAFTGAALHGTGSKPSLVRGLVRADF
jgi:hypothetical protein